MSKTIQANPLKIKGKVRFYPQLSGFLEEPYFSELCAVEDAKRSFGTSDRSNQLGSVIPLQCESYKHTARKASRLACPELETSTVRDLSVMRSFRVTGAYNPQLEEDYTWFSVHRIL